MRHYGNIIQVASGSRNILHNPVCNMLKLNHISKGAKEKKISNRRDCDAKAVYRRSYIAYRKKRRPQIEGIATAALGGVKSQESGVIMDIKKNKIRSYKGGQ